ncbi:MAG TPA: adenosylcobinamide-GDP ribazoletransferase [Methylomirabilota bacterium]|nr:adenosylcobinamide-GDP ribazoletransferase [Methylomirabilota bacterium]
MMKLADAVCFLTIVPVPGRPGGAPGPSAHWFPVVGFGLGTILSIADLSLGYLFPPALTAMLVLTIWELLTGGLHLDGLADSLDGLAGRDRDQSIRIMRDGRVGVFGSAGLILLLLLKSAALIQLTDLARWRALLVAPAIGRASPLLLAACFSPATPGEGKGSAFLGGVTRNAIVVGLVIAFAGSTWLFWPWGALISLAGFAVAVAWAAFFTRRLGGLTGDTLGGAVEIAELVSLLCIVALQHLRVL